jgi:hypothetical protein
MATQSQISDAFTKLSRAIRTNDLDAADAAGDELADLGWDVTHVGAPLTREGLATNPARLFADLVAATQNGWVAAARGLVASLSRVGWTVVPIEVRDDEGGR